jgi:hypothetical protein
VKAHEKIGHLRKRQRFYTFYLFVHIKKIVMTISHFPDHAEDSFFILHNIIEALPLLEPSTNEQLVPSTEGKNLQG